MAPRKRLILALGAVALAIFATVPNLYRQLQVRGTIPGGTVTAERVVKKWHERRSGERDAYWITWTKEAKIRRRGRHRIKMNREQWQELEIGQTIELVRFPNNRLFWHPQSKSPHIRGGSFDSIDNISFDAVLLLAELGFISYFLITLIIDRKRY